jgi:sirohydrochlorin cobaltochelatase
MLLSELETWLAGGGQQIGQLAVRGHYELCHVDDVENSALESFTEVEQARPLSFYDDEGKYRPLKTAPNLRHGWRLTLATLEEVRLALDHFYPAMLGNFAAWRAHRLGVTPFRETIDRQTGMYAITKKITDEQADTLIGEACADAKCRKTILWPLAPGRPVRTLPPEKFDPAQINGGFPLLCAECCNLLVAAAREVVKKSAA